MAIIKSKFKVKNGSGYDIHHFETETAQVEGLSTFVDNKIAAIPANKTLTIQKNGTTVDSYDTTVAKTINITVPTNAAGVGALPDSTKYGETLDVSYAGTTGVLTITLKDQDGTPLSTKTANLPLEMFLTSGTVEICETANDPVQGFVVGDMYLDLVLNNSSNHIYIKVSDLIQRVTIASVTGSGNVVTDLSVSGNTIIPTKGITALTAVKTLKTTNTTGLTGTSESLGGTGTINLHVVSKSGKYTDLLNRPTIPAAPGTLSTTNTTGLSASSSEALSGSIALHKIAKTGSYNDLLNKPSIPAAPGTLSTTNTTGLSASASEALSGSIALHKIAKTGSYTDLLNKPIVYNIAVQATQPTQTNNGDVWLDTAV